MPTVFRLDAVASLRRAVGARPDSDVGDLVACAWQRWRDKAPQHINGPFAFCLQDRRDGAVYLARDPMGEAALYYAADAERVWVSDNLDELLTVASIPDTVDFEALALRLARCYRALTGRTDFAAIAKVPPGALVRITSTNTQLLRYWEPGQTQPHARITFPDAVERADDLLTTAIADRLPVTAKPAVHLSGGLDSSTVAAMTAEIFAARSGGTPLAYSWSPRPTPGDLTTVEYATIEAVADDRGLRVRYNDPDRLFAGLAQQVDPLHTPPMAWLLEFDHAGHAARQGISTVITGWGGDEALSLHSRTAAAELARRGRLFQAWQATAPPPGVRRTLRGRLSTARPRGTLPLHPVAATYKAEAVEAWRDYSEVVAEAINEETQRLQRATTTRQRMIALLTRGHLTARNESWSRGGARLGIHYAHPLQDRRIVDFALSLPPQFFTYRGVHRRLFRSIAARHIPAEVIDVVKEAGTEARREELTAALVHARRPLVWQAQTDLGWPVGLIEAHSAMTDHLVRSRKESDPHEHRT